MLVQLQGREVWYLQLNEAVSRRLVELMQERGMSLFPGRADSPPKQYLVFVVTVTPPTI